MAILFAGWGHVSVAQAATPLEQADELQALCALGAPQVETDQPDDRAVYHERRRSAIYSVYETPLPNFDVDLLGYDQVAGLLTISGFREYSPRTDAPAIRIQNECLVSFEFEEEEVHDLKLRMKLGTVEMRIGYQVAAQQDYDTDFCPGKTEEQSRLDVELLYAQLIDREGSGDGSDRILATFHTPLGHRWALQQRTQLAVGASESVPQVQISHFQWRPEGMAWSDAEDPPVDSEQLDRWETRIRPALERAIYPCYVRALGRNASLQGALVLEMAFPVSASVEPGFLMDTLHMPELRQCVVEQMEILDELGADQPIEGVDAFKATVLMRRR